MTPDAFGRAIAVYPALLTAYAGTPVTLSPDDAIALLDLFDAVAGLDGFDALAPPERARQSESRPLRAAWQRALLTDHSDAA